MPAVSFSVCSLTGAFSTRDLPSSLISSTPPGGGLFSRIAAFSTSLFIAVDVVAITSFSKASALAGRNKTFDCSSLPALARANKFSQFGEFPRLTRAFFQPYTVTVQIQDTPGFSEPARKKSSSRLIPEWVITLRDRRSPYGLRHRDAAGYSVRQESGGAINLFGPGTGSGRCCSSKYRSSQMRGNWAYPGRRGSAACNTSPRLWLPENPPHRAAYSGVH